MSENRMLRQSPATSCGNRDAEVAAQALSRLRQSGYPALRQVRCSFSDGVLQLFGTLPSFHLRQIAEARAANVPEVTLVESRLHVS